MKGRLLCLVLLALSSCGGTDAPEASSGSHWVQCAEDTECTPLDPLAVCANGYCEDETGERLRRSEANAPMTPSTTPEPSPEASVPEPTPTAPTPEPSPEASVPEPSPEGNGGGPPVPPSAPAEVCPELPAPLEEANVYEGDFEITGASSLETAALFSEITGNLGVSSRAAIDVTELSLPGLERIGGTLDAELSAIVQIRLPRLETIGGDLVLRGNASLERAEFASLASVGNALVIEQNPELSVLSLPRLTQVGASVDIGAAPLPNCEIQAVFDALGRAESYALGRSDCSCEQVCERWTATCP